jgi:transposase-like protein
MMTCGSAALRDKVWTSKYLNNSIEHDYRRAGRRIYPMLGFNNLANAETTAATLS